MVGKISSWLSVLLLVDMTVLGGPAPSVLVIWSYEADALTVDSTSK